MTLGARTKIAVEDIMFHWNRISEVESYIMPLVSVTKNTFLPCILLFA